jgi:hypothetical protein
VSVCVPNGRAVLSLSCGQRDRLFRGWSRRSRTERDAHCVEAVSRLVTSIVSLSVVTHTLRVPDYEGRSWLQMVITHASIIQ